MTPTIAIMAPGGMGAAVATRLVQQGTEVVTSLAGRSDRTVERARAAGMRPVEEAALAQADILLSIVPPDGALPLARQLAPVLQAADRKPLYVDCNAVGPETVAEIAAVIGATGCPFVDAAIIGLPPKPEYDGPTFFASGPDAERFAVLVAPYLRIRAIDGPVGAASALKMCYGGITKALIAVGSAMMLAAVRAGTDKALLEELGRSQPALLTGFTRSIPDMFGKAGRWVPEMNEIAAFVGTGTAEGQIYGAIARYYERLAADQRGEGKEVAALDALLKAGRPEG